MPEKSFAEAVLKKAAVSETREWRKAFTLEREGGAQCFNLRVWFVDGRESQALHWSHYRGDAYRDDGGEWEALTLLFSDRIVRIKGEHFGRMLDGLDDGKLKMLQQQDSDEIKLIRAHNLDKRLPSDKEMIIAEIHIDPPFETLVAEVKGDETHAGNAESVAR
jgi:hypothetical protein